MSEVVEDSERDAVVSEELTCLERVQTHLRERSQRGSDRPGAAAAAADYELRLLDLRDQISSARMEDVPPLVQEMERLQDHVKASIAPFKYPRAITFVDQLPKTATGKIQRFRMREPS